VSLTNISPLIRERTNMGPTVSSPRSFSHAESFLRSHPLPQIHGWGVQTSDCHGLAQGRINMLILVRHKTCHGPTINMTKQHYLSGFNALPHL
jgi:hypothetical protein